MPAPDLSQIKLILDSVSTPIWIARQNELLYANPAAYKLLGSTHGGPDVSPSRLTAALGSASTSSSPIQLKDGPATQYSTSADSILPTSLTPIPELDFNLSELLGGVARWEWDVATNQVFWSAGHYGLLGYAQGAVHPTYEAWRDMVHPDDIAQAEQLASEAIAIGRDYQFEYRVTWPDGSLHWLESRGRLQKGTAGDRIVGVTVDITDRKQVETNLRESKERLQAALDAAGTGTFRWNIRTNALSWDRNLDRLFGLPQGTEVKNLERFLSFVHPEDRQGVIDACQACAASGIDFDMEFRVIWPDGTVRWLYDRGQMFLGSDGEPSYMTGACVDITERKSADEELRIGEERLRLALQFGASGTFDWDIVNNLNMWSEEIERIYGFAPGTFPGTVQDWEKCVHPADRDEAIKAVRSSLDTGEFSAEWRIIRRDTGEVRWIAARAKVLKDDAGRPLRMVGINTDTTEKKATDQMIRRGAQILDQIHDAVIATDLAGNITLWNNGAVKRFGYSADEAIGKHISLLYFPEDREEVLSEAVHQVKMKGMHEVEIRARRKDASEFFGHLSLSLLSDEHGTPMGMIGYTMDLTEKKSAERVLRAGEKLAATGRLASTLAHEINNPLEALTNIVFLLRHCNVPANEAEHSLKMAELELSRISNITRHLLAFHRQPSHPVEISVRELIEESAELYRSQMESKKITLRTRYKDVSPILAYPGEIRQVFANILNNAIEASPEGGRITVRVSPTRNGKARGVRLLIADAGRGIRKDQRSMIFEPFYTTKGDKGTGLGLWVSKDLVTKHGGRISVRSGSSGTCFAITLPLGSPAPVKLSRAV
jgi:PAS domain S-box-containing protein